MSRAQPVRVGVVGATGLVGTEMLRLLEERSFPVDELRVYASPRSEGRKLAFAGDEVVCEVLHDDCFDGLDFVVIDVDDPLALEWAPRAADSGARVVDNSAAFRMDDDVPLVVAEVNPEDVRFLPRGIVSCPNCTTMVPLTALAPLHRAAGIERMVVSTYQSVSGAGMPGLHELDEQWTKGAGQVDRFSRAGALGAIEPGAVWDRPIAGNVIPLAGSVQQAGYTSEEWKFMRESRKILHAPDLRVSTTCVRVPVYVGHAVAINVEFQRELPAPKRSSCSKRRRACASSTAATATPRPSKPPGSTRCSWAACASTPRRSARSTCGSPATTSGRAPHSTRSSSRS